MDTTDQNDIKLIKEESSMPEQDDKQALMDDDKQSTGVAGTSMTNGDTVNVEKMLQVFQQLASQQGTQQGNFSLLERLNNRSIIASGIQQQLLQQQVMQQLQLQQAVAAVQGLQKQLQDQFELARNLVRDLQNSSPKNNQPASSPVAGGHSGNNSTGNSPGSRGQDAGHIRNQSQSCRSMLPYSSHSPNSRNQNSGSGDLMSNPNPAGSLLRPQHGLPPLAARGRPHFHPGQMDDSIQVCIFIYIFANAFLSGLGLGYEFQETRI